MRPPQTAIRAGICSRPRDALAAIVSLPESVLRGGAVLPPRARIPRPANPHRPAFPTKSPW